MAKKAVSPSEVAAVLRKGGKGVNVGEIAEEIIRAMGGPREFAGMYVKELERAPEGGMAKTRMLDGVLRIIGQASAKNPQNEDDLKDMTDEDMIRELADLMSDADAAATNTPTPAEEEAGAGA